MATKLYALTTKCGTACSETVLTAEEYASPQRRAQTEAQFCRDGEDDPVPGSWTDVSDNDAINGANDETGED